MMITMAGLQVFIVRFFFQGARKGTYLISDDIVTWSSIEMFFFADPALILQVMYRFPATDTSSLHVLRVATFVLHR
jgi:hypothetical protein